jgi:uncharacterized protein YsxB (DUF464 family)
MIKIRAVRNEAKELLGFNVSGHANAAPYGQDIVCAAIAVLAQTAVFGLERHLRREIDLDTADGKLDFIILGEPDVLTAAILETAFLGMTEVAKKYPKFVWIS